MAQQGNSSRRRWWLAGGLLAAAALAGGGYYLAHNHAPEGPVANLVNAARGHGRAARVEVVRPARGGMERTTSQPGSVEAFEAAQLYAGVSGYLKTQNVDIGDPVKKGQVLATVDVPDLEKQVERDEAALDQARAKVDQMKARVVSARADVEAARAAVTRAEADRNSKESYSRFRGMQLQRFRWLVGQEAVDQRMVDEKREEAEAAREAAGAAEAAIAAAKAAVAAAEAKIKQAEADVAEAQSEVQVARADLGKARVLAGFANVKSPYDGIVTRRTLFPGDYVRAPREGGAGIPLLTVERTDKMRVVVQVPDRDVPYVDPNDPAVVELDALPGRKLAAKVARVAGTEDPQTRLMHVEIDLDNPGGRIRAGMYGRVTITLEGGGDLLSLPAACLAEKAADGRGVVFVVRDGHARRTPVRLGGDNGSRVAVAEGLSPDDLVAADPRGLADGAAVTAGPH